MQIQIPVERLGILPTGACFWIPSDRLCRFTSPNFSPPEVLWMAQVESTAPWHRRGSALLPSLGEGKEEQPAQIIIIIFFSSGYFIDAKARWTDASEGEDSCALTDWEAWTEIHSHKLFSQYFPHTHCSGIHHNCRNLLSVQLVEPIQEKKGKVSSLWWGTYLSCYQMLTSSQGNPYDFGRIFQYRLTKRKQGHRCALARGCGIDCWTQQGWQQKKRPKLNHCLEVQPQVTNTGHCPAVWDSHMCLGLWE